MVYCTSTCVSLGPLQCESSLLANISECVPFANGLGYECLQEEYLQRI